MWSQLAICHQSNPEPQLVHASWKTCLRRIDFLSPGPIRSTETHRGLAAQRFLVEVCAGLHSPLIGETEVFGQFREFRAQYQWQSDWNTLLDAVEEDARKVRREILTSLGSQNYGSLIRRFLLAGDHVVLVGAGHLAQEIYPWLEQQQVHCLVRNLARANFFGAISTTDPQSLPAEAKWIIAAPISNEDLIKCWKHPAMVLDLRAEFQLEKAPNYYSLTDLYEQISHNREHAEAKKSLAIQRIQELARARQLAVVHRPFGWEDAFA